MRKNLFPDEADRPCKKLKASASSSTVDAGPCYVIDGSVNVEVKEINRSSSSSSRKKRPSAATSPYYTGGARRTTKSKVRYFTLVRDEQEAKLAGFIYRKMWVADIPMLASGEGLLLLRNLKLAEFLQQPIPNLDKTLCDEFIFSFNRVSKSGTVKGQNIALSAPIVAAAVKLPLGRTDLVEAEVPSVITAEMTSALKRMLMNIDEKKIRGYDLGQLIYGEMVEPFSCVASALMTKMECTRECFHIVTPEILVALDRACRQDVEVQWAGHLAQLIAKAAFSTKRFQRTFHFGEWLTAIIQHQMAASSRAEDQEAAHLATNQVSTRLQAENQEQEAITQHQIAGSTRLQAENQEQETIIQHQVAGSTRLQAENQEQETIIQHQITRFQAESTSLQAENQEQVQQNAGSSQAEDQEHEAELRTQSQITMWQSENKLNDCVNDEVLLLRGMLEHYENEVAMLSAKADRSEQELAVLSSENQQQKQQLDYFEQEVTLKDEKWTKASEDKLATLRSENKLLEQELGAEKERLKASNREVEQQVLKIKTLEHKNRENDRQFESLRIESEQQAFRIGETTRKLEEELGMLKAENDQLVRTLKNESDKQVAELSRLEQERHRLGAENEQLMLSLKAEVDKLRSKNEQEMSSFTKTIMKLEEEVNTLSAETREKDARLESFRNESEQQKQMLEQEVSCTRAQLVLTSNDEKEQLHRNQAKLKAENADLRTQLEMVRVMLAATQAALLATQEFWNGR